MENASLKTKFLVVGSFLGHMSMKEGSNRTYCLGPKIRQRDCTGGGTFLPMFLTMKMRFNLNKL